MMTAAKEYAIPPTPPAELLAELDVAARTLDELSLHGGELRLELDERTGRMRIQLENEDGLHPLTPSELFALLASDDL